MDLTLVPPLVTDVEQEDRLHPDEIPCAILNPTRPASDIKTLGLSEQQLYWYGETYKEREVIHYPQGISWMGSMGFEKIVMEPMGEPTDFLTWFFTHPSSEQNNEAAKFNLRCDGSYNKRAGKKLIQFHTAYFITQLHQLSKQVVDLNTTVGTLYAKPLDKVTVLELWTCRGNNQQRKTPIQFDSGFHRDPVNFERMVNDICKALGQTAVYHIYCNDYIPDHQ